MFQAGRPALISAATTFSETPMAEAISFKPFKILCDLISGIYEKISRFENLTKRLSDNL